MLAQNNTSPWPANGDVGIGINTPVSKLHVHDDESNSQSASRSVGSPAYATITLTNSDIGATSNDGLAIKLSGTTATLTNQENGLISLYSNGTSLGISGTSQRICAGFMTTSTSSTYAKFNIRSSGDDGLYVRTTTAGKTAAKFQAHTEADAAIRVIGVNSASTEFAVTGDGNVYGRRFITTLDNISIPDYVFKSDYALMPLDSVETYIEQNGHLPNIPSEEEFKEKGEVDLTEMNMALLEKVEELTLYIIELNKKIEKLEEESLLIDQLPEVK